MYDRDAELLQFPPGTDARGFQDLRRAVSAARHDHLATHANLFELAAVPELDARDAAVAHQQALAMRVREHPQIRPMQVRVDEGGSRAATFAVLLRGLRRPAAEVILAVIVGIERNTRGLTGVEEDAVHAARAAQLHDVERPPYAVVGRVV